MSIEVAEINDIQDATRTSAGAMVIERTLQNLLKQGFAQLKVDTSLVDDLFYKLDLAARNDIKAFFSGHNIDVRVNFPKDDIIFPLVAIISAEEEENEANDLLGNYLTTEDTTDNIFGHALRNTYQILCIAGKDANASMWMYYGTKAILLANIMLLQSHGLHNITISGQDITLREDLFPELTYARTVILSCNSYFAIRVTERVARSLVISVFTEQPEFGRVSLEDET